MFKSLIFILSFCFICLAQTPQQQQPITPQMAVSGLLNAQAQMTAQNSIVLNQLLTLIIKQDSIIQVQQSQLQKKAEVKK
jgi:hypothetical protein